MSYICFLDVKIPEDDLKNIETCRIICVFNVKVYFQTSAFSAVIYRAAVEVSPNADVR